MSYNNVGMRNLFHQKLERSGLIESRRRNGTVVVGPPGLPPALSVRTQAFGSLILDVRRAGASDETLIDLVRGRLASKLDL